MKITITLPMNHPETTIRDLLEKEWLVPRKVRHFLRIRKNVWINQQPALFHHEVKGNDQITLLFEETDYNYQEVQLGDAKHIRVLYEDEHLIIVDKPAGMKTHPNEPTENSTLLNHLAAYLDTKQQRPYGCPPLGQRNKRCRFICKKSICLADTWKNVGTKNDLSEISSHRMGRNCQRYDHHQ